MKQGNAHLIGAAVPRSLDGQASGGAAPADLGQGQHGDGRE